MKKILTILTLILAITVNSQNTDYFVKIKKTNNYAFIEQSSFNPDSMINYSNPYMVGTFGVGLMDYVYIRTFIKNIVAEKGFHTYKSKYKDIIGIYCASSDDTLIAYYMSEGMTQLDAVKFHSDNRMLDISKAGSCYCNRVNKSELQKNIILFLGEVQASALNDTLQSYKFSLCTAGKLGTQYDGSGRVGIMDYLECTDIYVGKGLSRYSISPLMISVYGSEEIARQEFDDLIHSLIIVKSCLEKTK